MKSDLFNELFVLELANNHWGDLRRGLQIVQTYADIIKKYQIKAAIKLQFRDTDTFIHKDYKGRTDIRYVHRTEARILSKKAYRHLVETIRSHNIITMSTPFDEESVDFCEELDIDIIKIASFDLNDWALVYKILEKKRPTIVSVAGANIRDIDRIVNLFNDAEIPLAINQCVSIYPSEPEDLDLNQITLLINRYPDNVIGLSSHEYQDHSISLALAYGMGARTFERHIDIPHTTNMSVYNMQPYQCETWFKTFVTIKKMCKGSTTTIRTPPVKEIKYINEHVRGIYAKRDLVCGDKINSDNFYLAVPICRGQLSCREIMDGGDVIKNICQDRPLMIEDVDAEYVKESEFIQKVRERGVI
jgi:N-acetylneuraminate synthase